MFRISISLYHFFRLMITAKTVQGCDFICSSLFQNGSKETQGYLDEFSPQRVLF